MSHAARCHTPLPSEYDAACEALGRVVHDRGASTFALHAALTRLAGAARVEGVPPGQVLSCLESLIAKSPLAEAHRSPDGAWYSSARRLVATVYYS